MRGISLVLSLLVLTISGCTQDGQSDDDRTSLDERLDRFSEIEQVKEVIRLTEDNDPEGLLGKPDGYVDAAVIHDESLPCPEPDVYCGAVIEEWTDPEALKERSGYTLALLNSGVPGLGTEEHLEDDGFLLRVVGDVPPARVKAYKLAFHD